MIFQKKTVYFAVWDYYVYVIVTEDFDVSARKLKLRDDDAGPYNDGTTGGVSLHVQDNAESYLLIKPNATVKVVAHESWHCIRRMLKYAGAELDNETTAYHLGYLAGEAYAFAHKRRK